MSLRAHEVRVAISLNLQKLLGVSRDCHVVARGATPPLDWSKIGFAEQGLNKSRAPREQERSENSNCEADPALVVN
jgi:hypothetical protein